MVLNFGKAKYYTWTVQKSCVSFRLLILHPHASSEEYWTYWYERAFLFLLQSLWSVDVGRQSKLHMYRKCKRTTTENRQESRWTAAVVKTPTCLCNIAKQTQTRMTQFLHVPEKLWKVTHVLTFAGGKSNQKLKRWHTACQQSFKRRSALKISAWHMAIGSWSTSCFI